METEVDPVQQSLKAIERYFSAISSWLPAYRAPILSYFGIVGGKRIRVCSARIRLTSVARKSIRFRTSALAAGQVPLSQLRTSAKEIVEKLIVNDTLELRTVALFIFQEATTPEFMQFRRIYCIRPDWKLEGE